MPTELVGYLPPDESLRPGVDDRLTRTLVRPSARRRPPAWLLRGVGPLVVLAAWSAASGAGLIAERVLPAPWTVVDAAAGLIASGQLQANLWVSLGRAMSGLAIGAAVGVLLALVSGLSKWGEVLIDANVQMLRAMPILALLPLAIVWLGIGEQLKITLVALGVLFPIYLNTHAAIRSVDARYIDLARTVGLGRIGLIRRVILPGALPGFFIGLRFSAAVAWLVLVVSEQVNASSGIGYLMTQARSISATDVIVVGLVVYALLGLVSDTLVRAVERRALAWRASVVMA